MKWETIELAKEGHTGIIMINRPKAANALNMQLAKDMKSVLEFAEQDDDIWAAILTGAGDRAFCAGADMKERLDMSESDYAKQRAIIIKTFKTLDHFPKPIIAAVNGVAVGGGLIFALHSDIIYMSDTAKLSMAEVRLGLVGGTVNLPRMIGKHKAKELLFTGRTITAQEAYELGIVNKVVPAGELMQYARNIADEITQNAPFAVQQAKKLLNAGPEVDIDTAFLLEAECYNVAFYKEDRKEGLRAFNEKRKPVYTGK